MVRERAHVHPIPVALLMWPVAWLVVYLCFAFQSWIPFGVLLAGLYLFAWREDARRDPRVWYPFRKRR